MRRRLSQYIILAILVLACITPAPARQWPDDPGVMVGGFGAPKEDSFAQGLEFPNLGERIRPWSDGEVIWHSGSDFGLDGLVVLEHADGFRSGYRGIEGRPDLDVTILKYDWIGYAGAESWTFFIKDTERSRIVDPLTLLPAREDLPPPSLGKIELKNATEIVELRTGIVIKPGPWTFAVDAGLLGVQVAAAREISLYWVGQKVGSLRFDSLGEQDEKLFVETPEPRRYGEVYEDDQLVFRDISFNTGQGILELRIRDELDRVVTGSWRLTIGN